MNSRHSLWILAFVLVSMPAGDARGWNHTGHRVIATVAYDELTPAVRARVDALLRAHPRYEQDLLEWMPHGYDQPARFAFGMAGFWPDIIRSQTNPMHFTHHKPMWHFITVRYQLPDWKPAPATATAPATGPATQPVVEGPKDVVEAIAKLRTDLKNPAVSDADKAVAICWLAHLVGDVHQPLHATTLYSAQFPDGDNGGNRFIVALRRGQQENLHAVWDQMLGSQVSAAIVDYLAGAIARDATLGRGALPEVAKLDAETWVAESHALGKSVVYREGTLLGASSEALRSDPATPVPALPEDYLRNAEPVAIRRAALAGRRLADVLNEALAEQRVRRRAALGYNGVMDINLMVLNVGNSRLAIGVFVDGTLEYVTRVPHTQHADWAGKIATAWAKVSGRDGAAIAGASVNPALMEQIEHVVERETGTHVQWVGADVELPVKVNTEQPGETGVDRVLNMAAAYEQMGKACVVVDAGSAITVDCCDDQGTFLGGAIAPGVNMQLDALKEKTAKLPRVDLDTPAEPFGRSTEQAIRHGVYYGVRGMVKELAENYATELGFWPDIIATGGDAPRLFEGWELIHAIAPDLTLYGIALAYTNHQIKHGT